MDLDDENQSPASKWPAPRLRLSWRRLPAGLAGVSPTRSKPERQQKRKQGLARGATRVPRWPRVVSRRTSVGLALAWRWLGAGLALAWRWWASSRGWSRPTGFCRCLASGATKARTEQRALSSGVQSARNKLLAASTATKAYRNYYYHHSDSPPNPGTQSPTSSGAAPQPPRQSPHTRGQLAGEKKLCWLPDELSKEHPR